MNARNMLSALVTASVLAFGSQTEAADKVRIVTLSKVEASKGRLREKQFTKWMTMEELREAVDKGVDGKKQVLFFEYNGPTDKWRGIFTDKVAFADFSWWALYGEAAIQAKLNEEIKEGRHPVFIARNGSYYSMLTVSADDFGQARNQLAELGIGEPKTK